MAGLDTSAMFRVQPLLPSYAEPDQDK